MDKTEFMHRWGIPVAHALLWIIGMLVTTDLLGVIKQWFPESYIQLAVSLGTVVVIFFGEIALSFIDVVLEQRIKTINVTFLNYIQLLFWTLTLTVVFMFLGCYFLSVSENWCGKSLIIVLIIVSAFAKGMEIWLQNNWDRYIVDVSHGNPQLSYSIS